MIGSDKNPHDQESVLREFRTIPGVGKVIAKDLWDLGYRSIRGLRDEDPEDMYRRLCDYKGAHVDRCMLYALRCIVYFASHEEHDPALLKWYNWKDSEPD